MSSIQEEINRIKKEKQDLLSIIYYKGGGGLTSSLDSFPNAIKELSQASTLDTSVIQQVSVKCPLPSVFYFKWVNGITDYKQMHINNTNLLEAYFEGANLDGIEDFSYLFRSCTNLKRVDVEKVSPPNCIWMGSMFTYNYSLTELDFSNWTKAKPRESFMTFYNCFSLKYLDISGINFSLCYSCYAMFSGCKNLQSLDVSAMKNNILTLGNWMFSSCSSIKELDLSNFNFSKNYYFHGMFQDMTSLEKLNLSNCDMTCVTNIFQCYDMFKNTPKLKTIICDGLKLPNHTLMSRIGISSTLDLDSIIGLLNALPNTTKGYSFLLGQSNIDLLSDEQKAIAINKGWTLI